MRPLKAENLKWGINEAMKGFEDVEALDFVLRFLTLLNDKERTYLEQFTKRMFGF